MVVRREIRRRSAFLFLPLSDALISSFLHCSLELFVIIQPRRCKYSFWLAGACLVPPCRQIKCSLQFTPSSVPPPGEFPFPIPSRTPPGLVSDFLCHRHVLLLSFSFGNLLSVITSLDVMVHPAPFPRSGPSCSIKRKVTLPPIFTIFPRRLFPSRTIRFRKSSRQTFPSDRFSFS